VTADRLLKARFASRLAGSNRLLMVPRAKALDVLGELLLRVRSLFINHVAGHAE
jgi:hypothetical protein